MRAATRAEHEAAEGAPFVVNLLDGRLPRPRYAEFLAQLAAVYGALESAGRAMAGDKIAGPFVFPELERVPALEADLDFLYGARWRTDFPLVPAAAEYVERLETRGTDAVCFVAHHYTRYLGDLSGGRILRDVVARSYDLSVDGMRFYDFARIRDHKAFKGRYRALLDDAPFDRADRWRFVDEVARAYRFNARMFDDLDRDAVGS